MDIELLITADYPYEDAAAELITTAVADTGANATVTRTTVMSQDQARQRGSPTILIDDSDPFTRPEAPIALACRLYATPDGLRDL